MRRERSKGDIARQGDTISFTVSPCRALCFKRKIQNKLMTWDLYSQNRVCCEASPNAKSGAFICSDHSIRTITALETLTSIHSNIWYVANDLFEMKRLVWYTTHIYIYTFPTPPLQTGDIYIYMYTPMPPEWGIRLCGRIQIRPFKLKSCHYNKKILLKRRPVQTYTTCICRTWGFAVWTSLLSTCLSPNLIQVTDK